MTIIIMRDEAGYRTAMGCSKMSILKRKKNDKTISRMNYLTADGWNLIRISGASYWRKNNDKI